MILNRYTFYVTTLSSPALKKNIRYVLKLMGYGIIVFENRWIMLNLNFYLRYEL